MKQPLRVVLVAEESAGVQVLNELVKLAPAVEVAAVLARPEPSPQGRALVHDAARKLGLETLSADLVRSAQLAERLRAADVDLFLNVHSLFIVHRDVLAAPAIGSFNLHPGPLPQYAGLNAPSWAIYNGEQQHAVTLHWMDAGVDSGPIAWSSDFELTNTDTGLSASAKCVRLGVPLVGKLVETALADPTSIPQAEQDPALRRYFDAAPPNEGRLDWDASADQVLRFVRAADYAPFPSPWGHPTADLLGKSVGIARAVATGAPADDAPGSVRDISRDGALVATRDELVLVQRVWTDGSYRKPTDVLAD